MFTEYSLYSRCCLRSLGYSKEVDTVLGMLGRFIHGYDPKGSLGIPGKRQVQKTVDMQML